MPEKRFKFTDRRVRSLPTPESQAQYFDTDHPKLSIRVFPSSRVFYFQAYDNASGRTRRLKLGKFPEVSVETAREAAFRLSREVALGSTFEKLKPGDPESLTVEDVYRAYIAEISSRAKASTLSNYANSWRNYCSELAELPARKLQERDLEEFHKRLKGTPYAANRALQLISTAFNAAVKRGELDLNPAAKIHPYPEISRKRFLEPVELSPFLSEALLRSEVLGSSSVDVILTALFTGIRRENVASAKWDDVDLGRLVWFVPETKNGQPMKVYIPPRLGEMFRRRADKATSEFVFESPESSTGYLREPKTMLRSICEAAKINPKGINMHALKHTFVTYAAEAGLSPVVVAQIAGHKLQGITFSTYAHTIESRVRAGYARVEAHIYACAEAGDFV